MCRCSVCGGEYQWRYVCAGVVCVWVNISRGSAGVVCVGEYQWR